MFAKFCKHRGYEGLHDFCHVQKPHSEAYYTCHIIQYQKKGGTEKEWVTLLMSTQGLSM
jgi:hypothetical protein